ncbi:hypothetical protein [Negadavirga shengliensis]|uniref:Uncharacterized protein n=1 Tax=Negadavirga shengliensis TaxID=1389218 RepID=A0ABV9T4W7_9BACT
MKKSVFLWLLVLMISQGLFAQEKKYLVFEFIRVDPNRVFDYLEYKDFLAKVYERALQNGAITGWDLWSLQSGTEGEPFQYATITYYNDPVKMMNGNDLDQLVQNAKEAFPDMSETEIASRFRDAIDNQDLAVRNYMVEVARTDDSYNYRPGTLASFDLMKAVEGKFDEYEKAEREVFLPIHEKKIKAGLMENWRFLRTAVPTGSEAKSTHMTMNVYSNYVQFFNSMEYEDMDATESQLMEVEKGLKSRDQKWVYLATLESMVR